MGLQGVYGVMKEEKQSSILFLTVLSKGLCHFRQAISHALFAAQQNASLKFFTTGTITVSKKVVLYN